MFKPRHYLKHLRQVSQWGFLLFSVWVGIRFAAWVRWVIDPSLPEVARPAAVEAFMPIGGYVATKLLVFSRIADPIHPAGMAIFIAVVVASAFAKKGFCGWVCPVGTISETVSTIGRKVLGRSHQSRPPKLMLDLALMSVKYALMAIFVLVILLMPTTFVFMYMTTDYYITVDYRMMTFFTDLSLTAGIVLAVLGALTLVIKSFWCRYLCPYGALLGLVGYFSPVKIRRQEDRCIHCSKCTKTCPMYVDVEQEVTVSSPECIGCLRCVAECPAEGALDVGLKNKAGAVRRLSPMVFVAAFFIVFYAIIGIAMATGTWHSQYPLDKYRTSLQRKLGIEPAATIVQEPPVAVPQQQK